MRALVIGTATALATVLAACGGGGSDPSVPPDADRTVDARPPGPCWPDLVHVPHGSAVLGTGRDGYQPMPDDLRLEYGTQDGFMLIATVRMSGFEPGDPFVDGAYENPRTRILAYFDETNIPLNASAYCSYRRGYVPLGNDYELVEEAPVIFDTCWRSEHLFGKRIRIELELMDNDGRYTTDVKVVTAREPDGVYPVDMGTPGCPTQPVDSPLGS